MTKKVKIIGLGGIGTYLVEPLVRYLSHQYDDVQVTLIDGDTYEEKNRGRQRFSKFDNKASVTSEELAAKFSKIHFKAKQEYLDDDNVTGIIRENDIVFACVDNHATRKVISDRCEELDNVTLISGGNDYTDGNVILYRRKDGNDIGRAPTSLFKEIANPQDVNPATVATKKAEGCIEQTDSNPQLLFTNNAIAATMCNVFYAVEQEKAEFEQVFVDIVAQRSRPTPENNVFDFFNENEEV